MVSGTGGGPKNDSAELYSPVGLAPAGTPGVRPGDRGDSPDDDGGPPTRPVAAIDRPTRRARRAAAKAEAAAAKAAMLAARPPLRRRILPRSLLGISSLILAFSIGAAFSGTVLYSYYQYQMQQSDTRVNTLINGYKQQFRNAEGQLVTETNAAKAQIQSQLAPIQEIEADPVTLSNLVRQLGPSLFFVHTLDADGQPSVGAAFVISSNARQSLLLTSYTTIAASARDPGPDVYVRQDNVDTKVTVRSWDPQYDLALIVLPRGGLPVAVPAPTTPAPQIGNRVYALSGLGSAGASITEGSITDVSTSGIQQDAPIGADFQGGPLVNASGQVIAVTSRKYAPLGFSTDGVWFAPYVEAACARVLDCPGGSLAGSS